MANNAYDYDRCRSCGGPLQILDASHSLTVTCVECADTYDLEPDADDERCVTDPFAKTVQQTETGGNG
jgi:hypothetical protein